MARLLLFIFFLPPAFAQESFWQSQRFSVAEFVAAQGWDAAITQREFSECKSWEELNPIIPRHTAERAAYFAVTASAVIGTTWLLFRRGHPRLSKFLLRGATVMEVQAATRTSINGARCP